MPNLRAKTLGGKQFWTDHAWRRGWKVQQNAVTKHWRLLDAERVRQTWGTQEACRQLLRESVPDATLKHQRVIVLVHGLMRSSNSMDSLGRAIEAKLDGQIATFEYASTRASITDHALAFRSFIASLPADTDLHLVGHSMGNIVIRHAIGDWQREADTDTLNRVRTCVMLGPPNQGASIARQLSKVGAFEWIAGPGGMELGPRWQEFEKKLAIPHCPFGIVAGKVSNRKLKNPLVDGAGDLVVSVEEVKLAGARDFLEVPQLHTFLMDDPQVQNAVIRFMQNGQFAEE